MHIHLQTPFKAINKAYLKEKISRNNRELFKQQLTQLFIKATEQLSEDTLKDFITELLCNNRQALSSVLCRPVTTALN